MPLPYLNGATFKRGFSDLPLEVGAGDLEETNDGACECDQTKLHVSYLLVIELE